MKRLLLILSVFLLVACAEDDPKVDNPYPKTLSGTEWVGQLYDYEKGEYVTATVKVSEKTLTVNYGGNVLTGTYTYNPSLGTGVFYDTDGNSGAFEIKGNDLTLYIEDIEIKFKRTK